MKTKIAWVVVTALICLQIGIAVAVTHNSRVRASLAESWTTEGVQIEATGPINQTLFVVLVDHANDRVSCDVFVDSVVMDPAMSKHLLDLGFTSVQCMNIERPLK